MVPRRPPGLEAIIARGPQTSGRTPDHLLTREEEVDTDTLGQQPVKYKEWMRRTKLGWSKPRSSRLKKIDKALKEKEKAIEKGEHSIEKDTALRTAINDWIKWKAYNKKIWQTSQRNTDGVVEELKVYAFAGGLPRAMTQEERDALKFVEDARKEVLLKLFKDKHIQLKIQSAMMKGASAANDVKTAAKEFHKTVQILRGKVETDPHRRPDLSRGMSATGKAATETNKFMGNLFDETPNPAMISELKKSIPIDTITTDFIPFVNIVTGGIGLIVKWGKVAKAAHDVYKTQNSRYVIEMGDAQKAMDGVMKCLKRDRTSKAVQASQASAKFAGQTAMTFVDMGAASGPALAAANAAATLAHKIFLFGREYKEVKKANEILSDPRNLNYKLFETYPLAGCYMIRCATLSDILAMTFSQFGNPGWMDDVEFMKKKYINPIRKHCDRFIKESLFEIPDMPLLKMSG